MSNENITVTIEKLVQGGAGLARTENGVVFVHGALPGETVECRVLKRKKDYLFCDTVSISNPSPMRSEPVCSLYGICGGCDFQHIKSSLQAGLKAEIVRENLKRFGKIDMQDTIPVNSGSPAAYRSRARFQVDADNGTAGFFKRNSSSLVAVESCPVLIPQLNQALQERDLLLSAARSRTKSQQRKGTHGGSHKGSPRSRNYRRGGARGGSGDRFGRVSPGVYASANANRYAIGHEEIIMTVNGMDLFTEPEVFFQSNVPLFGKLLDNFLEGLEGKIAVDLYSGVGAIAAFLEPRFSQVTAVEQDKRCLQYARRNLRDSTRIVTKSVEHWAAGITRQEGIDLLAVDPPRTGLSKEIYTQLENLMPEMLLYVSCDSVSFSRDCNVLIHRLGYKLQRLEAYDFYPQTSHLETAAIFTR